MERQRMIQLSEHYYLISLQRMQQTGNVIHPQFLFVIKFRTFAIYYIMFRKGIFQEIWLILQVDSRYK
jgi:hypothetical protein